VGHLREEKQMGNVPRRRALLGDTTSESLTPKIESQARWSEHQRITTETVVNGSGNGNPRPVHSAEKRSEEPGRARLMGNEPKVTQTEH
jgi:hypothetical protein